MAYSRKKIESNIGTFIKQYKRKSNKCFDPNDRSYDRELEKIVKKMRPEDLSKLMHGEDEIDSTRHNLHQTHDKDT